MRFKNKTGWIHEELEKKNECLDANEFGGENPEDVEKQREENAKEINKRFDGVRKTAEKTVGDDHEEHAKPHKVEEHFKTRKELAEATKELKDNEIKFTINRSSKEGFRYVLEYFTTARPKDIEPLFEKIELEEGSIEDLQRELGAKLLPPQKKVRPKKYYEVYWYGGEDEEGTVIGDPIFKKFSSKSSAEKWYNEHKDDSDKFQMDSPWEEYDESLNEGHVTNEYKGYELDWNDDSLDLENGVVDIVISIMKDGKEVATAKSFKEARKWIDDNYEEPFVMLDKLEPEGNEDKEELEDMEIMPYGKVTQSQWEEFIERAKWPYWVDWETLVNEFGLDESLTRKQLIKEDLPDAIPEEPLVVSTDIAPEIPAEVVPDEVVQTGIYSALSSELRDTLADIENLKSLTVTLVDEGREDIVDDLNTIIDDRTIHVGMLQTLMEKVDAKVEAEETNTAQDKEDMMDAEIVEPEVKEESLKEAVDIHVEDNEIIVSKDLEDVAIIPVDGEEEVKKESLNEDMKPWIMQQGENGEPEYIGFAKSHDDMLDKMVKSHASDSIGENTYIDELDKDTYEYIKKDLSDDEIKELDNYFKD